MEKINIAEILKDCPKGMELDCVLYNDVTLYEVNLDRPFPIVLVRKNGDTFVTTKYGQYQNTVDSKCVIFPKRKTTWEGFQRPFKDGDIVVTTLGNIAIMRKPIGEELFYVYGLMVNNGFYKDETAKVFVKRLATEEEKQKLFDAIKANGYKWNDETKTLEKLPKFKEGDRIKEKEGEKIAIVERVYKNSYDIRFDIDGGIGAFTIDLQDEWELVHNKFDINTLVPFESKVLVRRDMDGFWKPAVFGFYCEQYKNFYVLGGTVWTQCIPYDCNEHLLGTTNVCDEFYKTWKI